MNFWSIVIAAAIFILPSLLPIKNKGRKKTVSAPRETPSDDVSQDWTSFTEDEGVEEEDMDSLGRPVFSYENAEKSSPLQDIINNTSSRISDSKSVKGSLKNDALPVSLAGEVFDLRKAVIYQTVMERVDV